MEMDNINHEVATCNHWKFCFEFFAPSFSLKILSIFVHILGSIEPITPIWVSLERYFPPAEVEYYYLMII